MAAAIASLAVAVVAAAVRIATPFEHGVWLVAYLFLVGFVAQFLLARGQDALASSSRAQPTSLRQTILWNLGVVAVPLGVFAGARLPVVLGSICLLATLASHWQAAIVADRLRGDGAFRIAYYALLALMTASVFVGTALAWDEPWL